MMKLSNQSKFYYFRSNIMSLLNLKYLAPGRFLKFAVVGASGTVINLVVLYTSQEFILKNISTTNLRLKLSLSMAIFLSTINNYIWNRFWTWKDRKKEKWRGFLIQMVQYFLSCGLAISVQYIATIILSTYINYLLSNIISIVISAILVYLINDKWTFTTNSNMQI